MLTALAVGGAGEGVNEDDDKPRSSRLGLASAALSALTAHVSH